MPHKSKDPQNDFADVIADIRKGAELKVLILGPGPSGGRIYTKRCEIRDIIKEDGHTADFCEDIWKPDKLKASGLNLTVAEILTAKQYDYIICLMESAGAISEAHDFVRNKKIASKMMICLDIKHKGGYIDQGFLRTFEGFNGKVDRFRNPADLVKCHLATRILEQVKKVSEAKQLELALGDS